MPSQPPAAGDSAVTVVIRAPLRRDADVIKGVLVEEGQATRILSDDHALELDHTDVLICTQEALTCGVLARLRGVIAVQPPWAHYPILLLLDAGQDMSEVTERLGPTLGEALITILHRPVRPLEFRTAVRNAVTARQRQLEIRDHLAYQVELRRELNHRVKNTIATFHAIYRMTARQSQTLEDFSERFDGRLRALSAVHERLYAKREAKPRLADVVNAMVAPYSEAGDGRVRIDGPEVTLDPEAAMTIALVLNEIATNAAKYGALSGSVGTVNIVWSTIDAAAGESAGVRFDWTEENRDDIRIPVSKGYGTRFIEASAKGMGGETAFHYRPKGLAFTMVLPQVCE